MPHLPLPPRRRLAALALFGLAGLLLSLGLGTPGTATTEASPKAATAPPPDWLSPSDPGPARSDELRLTWLGTAGFYLETRHARILIDPYYTRASLWRLLRGPIVPDAAQIAKYGVPADAVFIGHAHFDHMLDAPTIARQQHIPLYGSDEGLRVAAAEGLPGSLQHPLTPGRPVTIGDVTIEPVESRHSSMPTQWLAGGDIGPHPHVPMGFLDYKNGPVYGFLIRWRGRTVYHSGTAELVDASLGIRHADVLLQTLSGWTSTPRLFERLAAALSPRVLVPTHDDDFFKPYADGFHENLLAKRAAAFERIHATMPATSLVTMDFFTSLTLRADPAVRAN